MTVVVHRCYLCKLAATARARATLARARSPVMLYVGPHVTVTALSAVATTDGHHGSSRQGTDWLPPW